MPDLQLDPTRLDPQLPGWQAMQRWSKRKRMQLASVGLEHHRAAICSTYQRVIRLSGSARRLRLFVLQNSSILRGEMARIQRGEKHMHPPDMSGTHLDTPRLNEQDDVSAWQASSGNAAAQLEHQHSRYARFGHTHVRNRLFHCILQAAAYSPFSATQSRVTCLYSPRITTVRLCIWHPRCW